MVVDTGCSVTAYSKELKSQLGTPLGSEGVRVSDGSRKIMPRFAAPNATLDGNPLPRDGFVISMDVATFRESFGQIDGFLGMDFLRHRIVQIDFDEGKMRLLKRVPDDAGEKVQIKYNHGTPTIRLLFGRVEFDFVKMDTGRLANIGVRDGTIHALRSFGELRRIQPIGSDWDPNWTGLRGRVRRVGVGTFAHQDLHVDTCGENVLGLPYLSRFKIVFDFPGHALYLAPGRRFNDPDRDDMSGLWIRKLDRQQLITRLGADSPAGKAGLRKGDVILRIDGRDADGFSELELRHLFEEKGRAVALSVSRGGRQLDVKLLLDDYVDRLPGFVP